MTPIRLFITGLLLLAFTHLGSAKTIEYFNSVDGYSDTQGKNGWSYACVYTAYMHDIWPNQIPLIYDAPTMTWKKMLPRGPVVKITATQQNKFEGAGIMSLRYWNADRDYTNVVISSSLTATVPLTAFLVKIDAATHTTTQLTPIYFANANTLASAGGQQVLSIGTTLPNLHKGDSIYFVLRNEGKGDGNGTMQTWDQTIKAEGDIIYGVHAQSKPDRMSPYLDKAYSIYALGGPDMYIRDWWSWSYLQPTPDSIDWTIPDQAVQMAENLGQKLIVCLCYAPGWANGWLDRTWPATNPQDWKNFVTAVVSRYKDSGVIAGWEMWNEENTPSFFEYGLSGNSTLTDWQIRADDYAQKVLIPGYDAVRSVDLYTPVLFGGMAPTGIIAGVDNSAHGFFKRVLSNPTARNSFDYAGYHPYPSLDRIEGIFDQMKIEMAAVNIDRPVAVTEWGGGRIAPADTESAADAFVRYFCVMRTKDISYQCVHYSVDANGVQYGLFDRSIAQPTSLTSLHENDWRLTAYAYKFALEQLQDYDYEVDASYYSQPAAETVGYVYDSHSSPGSDKVITLWNTSISGTVEVLTGGGAQSATIVQRVGTGSTTAPTAIIGSGSDQRVSVFAGSSPLLIKINY